MSRWPVALWILILTSTIYFFSPPVADNDLWGHVAFGREMLRSGRIDAVNRYSYTEPMHPWINHELLAEGLLALVYDRFGSSGLLALKLLLGLATVGCVAATVRLRSREPLAGALALVATVSMMSFGYMIRPQLLTFLALAVLWNRLQSCAAGKGERGLWLLPPLFALWINAHGGAVAGILLLFAFTVLAAVEGVPVRRSILLCVSMACAGALLLNPYGTSLLFFLAADLFRDRPISEWAAISPLDSSNLHLKAAVVVLAGGFASFGPRRVWEVVILSAAAVFAFRHQRHLPLFAILAAPALAETLERLGLAARRTSPSFQLSTLGASLIAVAALAIAILQMRFVVATYAALHGGILASPAQFPVFAVRFLREQRLEGNLALPFDWGEYAIWHLYPKFRVSVDGRYTTAYSDELLSRAWAFQRGSPEGDRLLADASLALVQRVGASAQRLLARGDWQCIYSDSTALVFKRGAARTSCPPVARPQPPEPPLFP